MHALQVDSDTEVAGACGSPVGAEVVYCILADAHPFQSTSVAPILPPPLIPLLLRP